MEDVVILNETQFAKDILKGLSSSPKYIPSKYFYDEKGDKLFQEIMKLPEYYLSDSEYEIILSYKEELIKILKENGEDFNLIELGAGDAVKTKILLKQLSLNEIKFTYVPIDISENTINTLTKNLSETIPGLKVNGICCDYFEALEQLNGKKRNVVLFLGSNIGNLEYNEAVEFLNRIRTNLSDGDLLLIGFDLKKDPEIIARAYNDSEGVTSAFNLNLLERINKELGANFNINKFKHFPVYDPLTGEAKSYLISLQNQGVYIETFDSTFSFKQWESIYVEISKKYDLNLIEQLAEDAGFKILYNFKDCRYFFLDSFWCNKSC